MPTITVEDMCKAGCASARAVRYWEEQGLLGEVDRSAGGQRRYTEEQLRRAHIIAAAQFGSWSLDEAREMIENYDVEAYEALTHRLMQQATVAASLAEDLPKPPKKSEMAFDL